MIKSSNLCLLFFFPSSSFKLCKKMSCYKKLNVIVGICRCVDSNFNWHTTGLGKKNKPTCVSFCVLCPKPEVALSNVAARKMQDLPVYIWSGSLH